MSYKNSQNILEERKLVEESDNKLTESLFSDSPSRKEDDDIKPLILINKNMSKNLATSKKEKIAGNKEITEQKQKVLAIKNKNRKNDLHKKKEIFGEYDDDNYVKYCEIEEKYLD